MVKCHNCETFLEEDEMIPTDYFQVNGDQGEVIKVCGDCYLTLAKKFVAEKHEKCECGAHMIFAFDDEEVVEMGRSEWLLPLNCSKAAALIQEGIDSETLEEEHMLHFLLYTYSVPDEAMIWGGEE